VHFPRRTAGVLPPRSAYNGTMTVNRANKTKEVYGHSGNWKLSFKVRNE